MIYESEIELGAFYQSKLHPEIVGWVAGVAFEWPDSQLVRLEWVVDGTAHSKNFIPSSLRPFEGGQE